MHELSIASSIINIILDEVPPKEQAGVRVVGLKIGSLSGILPDALEFGFDAIKLETPLSTAKLVIEEVPLLGKCNSCHKSFPVRDMIFACPHCHSTSIKIRQGEELEISYIEIDEKELIDEQ